MLLLLAAGYTTRMAPTVPRARKAAPQRRSARRPTLKVIPNAKPAKA